MIKRLRDLLNDYDNCRANEFDLADAFDSDVRAMLDRLEKLEAVVEAAEAYKQHLMSIDCPMTRLSGLIPLEFMPVTSALAALEDK